MTWEVLEAARTSVGEVELVGVWGSDEGIAQVARTSIGPSGRRVHDDAGLVRYLVEHGHTGPLEFAETVWRVTAPVYLARQWLRHRTASVNEHSLRYSGPLDAGPEMPGSWAALDPEARETLRAHQLDGWEQATRDYDVARALGAKRETARIFLPLAAPTRWMWKIDLHNLLHFLLLRRAEDAQPEIREYAQAMERMIAPRFPAAHGAWRNFRADALTLAADEIPLVRAILAGAPAEEVLEGSGLGDRRRAALLRKLDRLSGRT